MDQVKSALRALKTHYFWVVCGLATVLVLGAWFMATSKLSQITEERTAAINQAFTAAQGVKAKAPHPNEFSHAEMDKMADALAEEVALAWREQYRRQERVLVWPARFPQNFRDAVRKLQPIEAKVEFPTLPENELNPNYRDQYRNYIEEELPNLAAIIKSKWAAKAASGGLGGGMYGSGGAESMYDSYEMSSSGAEMMSSGYGAYGSGLSGQNREDDGVVVRWSANNQTEIASRFSWPNRSPSTLDILYAQEDLWVLEAIMRIVADVNGPVQSSFNATIKEIEFIRIGRTAIGKAGQVIRPKAGPANNAAGGMMGGPYDMMMVDDYGGMDESMTSGADASTAAMASAGPTGTAGAAGAAALDPADMRYVDNEYQPLQASRVRTAMTSNSPDDAFLAVAKRMPVRIRFAKMDHRKLPQLLAACGNSTLPIEIRQVRINRQAAAGGGMMGGYGGMMGGGMMGGGMMGGGYGEMGGAAESMDTGYDEYAGGSAFGMGALAQRGGKEFPHDLPVEIYGIIYLYNPVDPEKLGIDVDTINQIRAETTAARAPAGAGGAGGAGVAAARPADTAAAPVAENTGGASPAAAVSAAATAR